MKGCLYISGNNYLFALFFFALAVQVVLLPLAIKQHKSQIMMAKIRPKEMAIREKYKGRTDKVTQQKMTMEIQEMYQKNGYNQFGGCLPLLIQFPIIIILFAIVRNPISYGVRLTDEKPNFVNDYASQAVVYYQEQKEALNKDAFASEVAYNEYIKKLEGYQIELGGTKKDDNGENALAVYKYNDKPGTYAEIALTRLMIDGKENVELLIKDGKLPKDFDISLLDKLDNYREKLPNYRVGPLNLINEPDFGENLWLMIIPVLVFLTSFFQTKLTRKFSGTPQTDANGNPIGGGLFMEVGMPLISALFAYSMSAAVGVYWIWRTLIGMVQTLVFAKAMPIPKITEDDIAAARKELKGKQKKKKVITIEVDEDDDSYDDMIVGGKTTKTIDPTQRKPRKIEMLTADDDEIAPSESTEESEDNTEN